MIEPLLLTTARIATFKNDRHLTTATGFYFEHDERLFLVTSRHVLEDRLSRHFPDRLEIELHLDANNVAQSANFSILLYEQKRRIWREESDRSGPIDIAVIELHKAALPPNLEAEIDLICALMNCPAAETSAAGAPCTVTILQP